jgi:DNA polymerase III delta prime subunit
MSKPTTPEQFAGKTAAIAKAVFNKLPLLKSETDPLERCYLFTGPPGTGKSSLAEAIAARLTGHPIEQVWRGNAPCVDQINGQSCSVDTVRRWRQEGWYHPLYGHMWVKIVDEIDAAGEAACNELRTYLDKLAPGTVFIGTTNLAPKQLQVQLQSRFKVHYFEPVSTESVASWLTGQFNVPLDFATRAARANKGNVRAARADTLGYLEAVQANA